MADKFPTVSQMQAMLCLKAEHAAQAAQIAALLKVARAAAKRYRYADAGKEHGVSVMDSMERDALAALEREWPGLMDKETSDGG